MIFRFKLTYSGADTTVIEPKGWADFKSEIKRDFNSHGVIFKYTSGTLKLGFADGRSVLETAFRNDGYDAVVTLTVDQRDSALDAWVNAFTGNAVMKDRELTGMYFNVDFEGSSFQQKVINRLNTKVRLDSILDLDGGSLSGSINEYEQTWNGIRLNATYTGDYKTGGNSTLYNDLTKQTLDANGGDFYAHMVVNFDGTLQDDLKKYQSITEAISDGQIGASSGNQNLIAGVAGDITILASTLKYRAFGDLRTTITDATVPINFVWKLRHENAAGVLQSEVDLHTKTVTIINTVPNTTYSYNTGVLTEAFTKMTITNVALGDLLFVYLEVKVNQSAGGGGDDSELNTTYRLYNNSRTEWRLLKSVTPYIVKAFMIFDVIERIIYTLTGRNNALVSDFLNITENGAASDGCGALNAIVNGSHLRRINDALEISLKECIDSLSAIYGIGWGFEKNGSNYDVRIELMEYFYQDGEILDLGSPVSINENDSYKEKTAENLTFNNVKIGYEKSSKDEIYTGSLDDFLATVEYSLPVSTISGDYIKISPFITSCRLIQATYEARDDLTKVWKYDNNIFLISVVRVLAEFHPENDENFESVVGLDDSTTMYNIRHAPVYMLLNHALIINSVLIGKSLTGLIQNTNVDINKDFKSHFSSYETCLLGDAPRQQRISLGNIEIGDNFNGLRLFEPIEHELTVAMTATQLNLIIDAMENNSSDSTKNLGYLTYRDNEGAVQTGYPLVIKWNPNDEIAEITTLEKADNYGI